MRKFIKYYTKVKQKLKFYKNYEFVIKEYGHEIKNGRKQSFCAVCDVMTQ